MGISWKNARFAGFGENKEKSGSRYSKDVTISAGINGGVLLFVKKRKNGGSDLHGLKRSLACINNIHRLSLYYLNVVPCFHFLRDSVMRKTCGPFFVNAWEAKNFSASFTLRTGIGCIIVMRPDFLHYRCHAD